GKNVGLVGAADRTVGKMKAGVEADGAGGAETEFRRRMRNVVRDSVGLKRPLRDGVDGHALNDDVVERPVAGCVVVIGAGGTNAVGPGGCVHDANGEVGVVGDAGDAAQIRHDLIVPAGRAVIGQDDIRADDDAVAGGGI